MSGAGSSRPRLLLAAVAACVSVALWLSCCLSPAAATPTNLLSNGDFSSGSFSPWLMAVVQRQGAATNKVQLCASNPNRRSVDCSPGQRYAYFNTFTVHETVTLSQTVTAETCRRYVLSYLLGGEL